MVLSRLSEFVTSESGRLEQSKLWANLGKALCVWLVWKHAQAMIDHSDVLAILMAYLIVPETARKIIEKKYNVDVPAA